MAERATAVLRRGQVADAAGLQGGRPLYAPDAQSSAVDLLCFGSGLAVWVGISSQRMPGPACFLLVALLTACYAIWHLLRYADAHRLWGLDPHRLWPLGLFSSVVILLGGIAISWILGQLLVHPRFSTNFLYLPWCLVQDYLFFSVGCMHLQRLAGRRSAVLITALAFGLAHAPYWGFACSACLLGGVGAWYFCRHQALLPILVCHWIFGRMLLDG